MEKTVVVYGSLRKKDYNYSRIGMHNNTEFLGEGEIEGYKLYSLGMYPCIYPSKDKSDKVIVEVYNVNETTFNRIDWMEKGAGYTSKEENVKLDNGEEIKGTVYIYRTKPTEDRVIKGGDWIKYRGL